MRNINAGWIIRYGHANGATMFLFIIYLHIARGLYYGSYTKPRVALWTVGVIIFLLVMGTAFLGKLHCPKRLFSNNNNSSNLPPTKRYTEDLKSKKIYHNLHTLETQLKILKENKHKSAIYLIYNHINNKFFIGNAITNRINVKFRNNCIHGTGNSLVKKAIDKYGLENFSFHIIEYYPGFVHKENLSKSHLELLKRETYYINLFNPAYNILTLAHNSLGFKHNKETIENLKANYSEEKKSLSGTKETKELKSKKMKIRYLETDFREFLKKRFSKPITLFNKDGTIHSQYESITHISITFKCCKKTINKTLKNNNLFKNIGFLKYTDFKSKDKTE